MYKHVLGELFRAYRISAAVLDEIEAHAGLSILELLDYIKNTYAGNSKFL
jgi:hypothetical protein